MTAESHRGKAGSSSTSHCDVACDAVNPRASGDPCWRVLEENVPFARSVLWRIQRRYYDELGAEAWRRGEVPQYISTNPTTADSFAEIVHALFDDRERLASGSADCVQPPVTIVELGAGSGRFAFHFLRRWERHCERLGRSARTLRYVMTDQCERLLEFWDRHPRFKQYFDAGVLDMAALDIQRPARLELRRSGDCLREGSLQQPLVVLASYVFDGVAPDLFRLDRGRLEEVRLSVIVDGEPDAMTPAEILGRALHRHEYRELEDPPYREAWLERILNGYRADLESTHLAMPAPVLRCLHHLRSLSHTGMMLLAADKGETHRSALDGLGPPGLVHHGSISLSVNFDAVREFCEQSGGVALLPERRIQQFAVVALLFVEGAQRYRNVQLAYQRRVRDFGPDDYYQIVDHGANTMARLPVEAILGHLRLGFHDPQLFVEYAPRLRELAPTLEQNQRTDLVELLHEIWAASFSLGESVDLANLIACLLYEVDRYEEAIEYFERSMRDYGRHTGTLYNLALCHRMLGNVETARGLLHKVVAQDPDNQPARDLLESGA